MEVKTRFLDIKPRVDSFIQYLLGIDNDLLQRISSKPYLASASETILQDYLRMEDLLKVLRVNIDPFAHLVRDYVSALTIETQGKLCDLTLEPIRISSPSETYFPKFLEELKTGNSILINKDALLKSFIPNAKIWGNAMYSRFRVSQAFNFGDYDTKEKGSDVELEFNGLNVAALNAAQLKSKTPKEYTGLYKKELAFYEGMYGALFFMDIKNDEEFRQLIREKPVGYLQDLKRFEQWRSIVDTVTHFYEHAS